MTWQIAAPDDPRLRPLRDAARHRDRPDPIVVEGMLAVQRALAAGADVRVVLATEACAARLPPLPSGTHGCIDTAEGMRAHVGWAFHRGCLALVSRPPLPPLADAFAAWLASDDALVVVAEALTDPVNVGAVLRNARAFAVAGVVFVGGADPWSPRAIRSAAGHTFAQPWTIAPSIDAALDGIDRIGGDARVPVWAATVEPTAVDVGTIGRHKGVLLVGGEGPGLSARARSRADAAVTIPMAPTVDSLNVAAATAILVHALRVQPSK